jgi:flagellar M-ring protein FliF
MVVDVGTGRGLMHRARDAWEQLPPNRRLALVLVLVGVIGTVALWAFLSSQVPYETAFRGLKEQDASAVVDKLRELQIPYQLGDDGTIRVPSTMVEEARIRVAGAGLLQGGEVGYEIFNQPSFGLSDFVQQVNYQRALEGELARSISQIDSVESARVHLAIPQPSVFISQQRDPSAAVMIALKPGRSIDKSQAQAIVNLVVGAVEGMKPSGVVLLDTQGRLLHKPDDATSDDPSAVSDQYAAQHAIEQNLQTRVQDLLDRVVGPGHSSAQVSVELDWSRTEATSEIYNPNNQQPLVRTSQDVKDTQASGAAVGGVPGVTSNVPTYQQVTPSPQGTGSEHTESNRTYELSRTVEKTQRTPGAVKRLSVAVAVDSSVADAATVDKLTKMVQSAVGFDAQRGDVVTVVPMPLKEVPGSTPATLPASFRQQWQTLEIARTLALVAGPLLAILVLGFVLLRRRSTRVVGSIRTMPVPAVAAPASPPITEAVSPMPLADPRRAYVRDRIAAIADRDPALVASILHAWVAEDKRGRQ